MSRIKPVVLIVLDGWGYSEDTSNNAIFRAKTDFFDSLYRTYPHTLLDASQQSVGLPKGQMGNSEVGHMTIGAGKIIDTDLVKIDKAIQNGDFENNEAFQKLFEHVKRNNSFLHVLGLLSDGGVHSHENHLYAFLKAAKKFGINRIVVHAITDGRDTAPQSAAQSLKRLENLISDLGIGFIASASGRFYAMDRDKNWDRLKKAERVIFDLEEKDNSSLEEYTKVQDRDPSEVLEELYKIGVVDEHLEPMVFLDQNGNSYKIGSHDGVFFFNFRADRAKQLATHIAEQAESKDICFVTMTEYSPEIKTEVAYPKTQIETTIAAEVSKAGLKQSHIAETEKYAHATYFLNGGRHEPHENEKHILVESRKDIPTHDLAPKMRAEGIVEKTIEELDSGVDFIFMNFANADMVGHTANTPAIIEAVEEVDKQLEKVIKRVLELGGVAIITADHGNAELNIDPLTGNKHTAHTLNLVPMIITSRNIKIIQEVGSLADIAPTVLELMDIKQPTSMTGKSLIV